MPASFYALKQSAQQRATRHYGGRGRLVKRCEKCQLSYDWCICATLQPMDCELDFIILFHRDELFKPTNTGKLIADCFPLQTECYQWSRTEPPLALLQRLQDPQRDHFILYPNEQPERQTLHQLPPQASQSKRRQTLIILDGTWRQSRRMFNASRWLANFPALALAPIEGSNYHTRVAAYQHYLSTAESVALALAQQGQVESAEHLQSTFERFNRHYLAMKQNRQGE
ncbi:MAG: DTW domain-containing protein [Gammaproteobacteria bacterium]|nr:DTW domain-containing protein [Gammaproteobacteria bacterium]NVK88760.1 DTW domain-containing protein [Gammaproteobacteria bacterium]